MHFAVRTALVFAIVATTAGCKSARPEALDAEVQPPNIDRDGVRWIAVKKAGDNHTWVWLPEPVAAVTKHVEWRKDLPVDILVDGRVWRWTHEGDQDRYAGPLDATGVPIDCGTMLCWFVVFVTVIALAGANASLRDDLKSEREKARAPAKPVDELAAERAELGRQQRALAQKQGELAQKHEELERDFARRRQELEKHSELALAKSIQAVRDGADERYRVTLTPGELEERDQRLREAQLMFSRNGRVICVRGFATPTGWLALEWFLEPSLARPLTVVGVRDGKVVFSEHAYRGMYCDILERGREYTFVMHAMEGKFDREQGFQFVVRLPTDEQWRRRIGGEDPISAGAARERRINERIQAIATEDGLWEKARREGHQRVEQSDGSEMEKKKRKASLDVKLQEERDREDSGAK